MRKFYFIFFLFFIGICLIYQNVFRFDWKIKMGFSVFYGFVNKLKDAGNEFFYFLIFWKWLQLVHIVRECGRFMMV